MWSHEALNFPFWVAENVDLLADAVGLDITVDETESSVGDFNVDIYASETGTDRKIIIENQLEDTDHWMDFSIGSSACHISVTQMIKMWCIDRLRRIQQIFIAYCWLLAI